MPATLIGGRLEYTRCEVGVLPSQHREDSKHVLPSPVMYWKKSNNRPVRSISCLSDRYLSQDTDPAERMTLL